MREIRFGNWAEVLAHSSLPERKKNSWAITLRWYLSFCRRGRVGVNVQSARDFVAWAAEEKQAPEWRVEEWKAAIRWFFQEAPRARDTGGASQRSRRQVSKSDPPLAHARPMAGNPQQPQSASAWKTAFLTVVRRRHYSYRTEQSYLVWIERFARYLGTAELEGQGEEQIKGFLDSLALNQRLSASSQRQALNALVFLYREVFGRELGDFSDYRRARARSNMPVWLTREEIGRLLGALEGRWKLMACVMYGSGLRLMELIRLRVKDVDLEQRIITVRGGKGDKDRLAPLAEVIVEPLQAHLQGARKLYDADRKEGTAGVWLPAGLERKYPKAGEEWPWFWVWPDNHVSTDPRSGVRRRHHVSDRSFQSVIKTAARTANLNKRVTPHVLRHTFATQSLEGGAHIRTLQELLGHKSVETTQIYTHVMNRPGLGVRSPLDSSSAASPMDNSQ